MEKNDWTKNLRNLEFVSDSITFGKGIVYTYIYTYMLLYMLYIVAYVIH